MRRRRDDLTDDDWGVGDAPRERLPARVPPRPSSPSPLPLPADDAKALVDAFWERLSPVTRTGYRSDLRRFCSFIHPGVDVREEVALDRALARVLDGLVSLGPGRSNALALRWRDSLAQAGRSSATVNRHVAALRSFVELARLLGFIKWGLSVKGIKQEPRRDMTGPSVDQVTRLLAEAARQEGAYGFRDVAIVRLLFDRGLRRAEVHELDVGHLSAMASETPRVLVRPKGHRERSPVDIAPETARAVSAWLAVHPDGANPTAPAFVGLGGPRALGRLSGRHVARILADLAARAGIEVPVRPHGLRHAAITRALDLSEGDLRRAQAFSRHQKIDMLRIYDDKRQGLARDMARRVALPEDLSPKQGENEKGRTS